MPSARRTSGARASRSLAGPRAGPPPGAPPARPPGGRGAARALVLARPEPPGAATQEGEEDEARPAPDDLGLREPPGDAPQAHVGRDLHGPGPALERRGGGEGEPGEGRQSARGDERDGEDGAQAHDSSSVASPPGTRGSGGALGYWWGVGPAP